MEKQPLEILQLSFKSRRLLMFANNTEYPVQMGDMTVVSVDRGEDIGRVVDKLPAEEIESDRIEGFFLRIATATDIENHGANVEFEKEVLEYCESRVKVRNLDMRLTDCESQLDRRRIRIFFTADQRTDFRGLVRDMASAFRARIEMRQIGVRDDAKYKDGVGICGRQLCCSGFLNEFKSVTLKSVRDQHLSPNPSKVSGACSRLMCCLEFETEFYHKASKTYPRAGLNLKVNGLQASVKEVNIFKEEVSIRWEDTEEIEVMSIEDYHRRKAMTFLPKPACLDKKCKTCSSTQSGLKPKVKPKPRPKPRPKLNQKPKPKPKPKPKHDRYKSTRKPTEQKIVEKTPPEKEEIGGDSEKPVRKNRNRGRGRYRRKSSKKEERTNDV